MFYSITPGAVIAAFIALFWILALCSAEEDPEEKKVDPDTAKEPAPYTEGWQDESVHLYVDQYGRMIDENGGVFINPLL